MDGPVLTRSAVRALDRRAIEEWGIPSVVLMENAGRACADAALGMLGGRGRALVLCGPGNNGGDGLVVARTLANRGVEASAVFVGPRAKLETGTSDFRTNLRLWRALGRGVEALETAGECAALADACARVDLVVDALFGTGLDRELGSPWSDAIRSLNASARPVLAVDVPSGLDADSGAELGVAVRARVTVTFVARKPGLLRGRGPELAGEVRVAEIGIPLAWIGPSEMGRSPSA